MALSDSTDKIIGYIKATQNDELILSPLFFRDYTCPSGCGGCCPKFSLDYFEGERWELFKKTYPQHLHLFEERKVGKATVYSYMQKDNPDSKCKFLRKEDGRCNIHKANPFSCEFELNKFLVRENKTYLINKLFGRGWNMMRVDGLRGALCEMKPFNLEKYLRDVELLQELNDIANQMGFKVSLLEKVINFLKTQKKPTKSSISFKEETTNNQLELL